MGLEASKGKGPGAEYLAQSSGDKGYEVLNSGLFFLCSNKLFMSVYDVVIVEALS